MDVIDPLLITATSLHRLQINPHTIKLSLKIGLVTRQRLNMRSNTTRGVILQFLEGSLGITEPALPARMAIVKRPRVGVDCRCWRPPSRCGPWPSC